VGGGGEALPILSGPCPPRVAHTQGNRCCAPTEAADWTTGEIATALDIGVPATKACLRRGRMMLVSALDQDDPRRQASLAQPMRCWEARRQVSAYLDDELDARARAGLGSHLAGCPTCPPLYAGLVGVKAALAGLRDPDTVVPEAVASRLTDGPTRPDDR